MDTAHDLPAWPRQQLDRVNRATSALCHAIMHGAIVLKCCAMYGGAVKGVSFKKYFFHIKYENSFKKG